MIIMMTISKSRRVSNSEYVHTLVVLVVSFDMKSSTLFCNTKRDWEIVTILCRPVIMFFLSNKNIFITFLLMINTKAAFNQEEFQRDVNMTYLAKIHFAGGVQSESGPNMSIPPCDASCYICDNWFNHPKQQKIQRSMMMITISSKKS